MTDNKRIGFIVEYFDSQASLTRMYQLIYYLGDNTIEMHDLKTRRLFLKRCACTQLSPSELFVGATINIFSRFLRVVDYADEATRRQLASDSASVMVVFHENGFLQCGNIVNSFLEEKLRITSIRMVDLPPDLAARAKTSRRCILASLNGPCALEKMNQVCMKFSQFVSGIDDADASFFKPLVSGPGPTTALMTNCAVCVIKPHAITSGNHGSILQRLFDEGFHVTALGMYTLTAADAEDFLEVYNGVMPEYKKMMEQLSSSPVWAIEVCAENAVAALRAVCGPHDPEVCQLLFPNTIRSVYGVDRIRNGVHCTDLEEDGPLESEFFFSLLQNKR